MIPLIITYYTAIEIIQKLKISSLNLHQSWGAFSISKIIDLACGKGRHSVFLNKLGYDVLGLDLFAPKHLSIISSLKTKP
ncbi:hypothetical protein [Chryseobacterium indoltheticum]|uniref:hypothetical protein n=1 Tax=Chryseobacterium indoltheticum TaxID=254 RepID=UPI003F498D83